MTISLTVPTTTRSILKVFRSATPAELEAGRNWYRRASDLARDLAREFDRYYDDYEYDNTDSYERTAAVIAVLSPRLKWSKNVEAARWVVERHNVTALDFSADAADLVTDFPGLKGSAVKALEILRGGETDEIVKGPKVRSFWHTIMDPSDPRAVVVDRHALDIAVGRVLTDEQRGRLLGRAGAYDALSTLYRRAARQAQKESFFMTYWTPAEVQAVTWVVWRRNHAATKKSNQREEI